MRSLKAGLFTFVVAGFFGTAAVIGCGADGSGDVVEDPNATEPTDEEGNQLPPSNPGTSSSGSTSKDAGKDAKADAKVDSGKDAGPPPPNEGDTCTKIDQIFTKSCGKCGQAQAICEAVDGGPTGKVSKYGDCMNQTGLCVPGDTRQADCGNCGKKTETCNQYCAWAGGTCTGQPTNSCVPGTFEYTPAGCAANQYRKRDCQTTCIWTTYAACAEPSNPLQLVIANTVNGTATGTYTLAATKLAKRHPTYTCGASASISSTADYPYELVELRNNSSQTATIKISSNPGFDTAFAVYPTNLPPQSDTELKMCTKADYSYSSSAADIIGVQMPANSRYLLRIASYWENSNTWSEVTTGSVPVTVTTTALQ